MSTPQNFQAAKPLTIPAAVAALAEANRGIKEVFDRSVANRADGDDIRQAFERAGLEFPDLLAAIESGTKA